MSNGRRSPNEVADRVGVRIREDLAKRGVAITQGEAKQRAVEHLTRFDNKRK